MGALICIANCIQKEIKSLPLIVISQLPGGHWNYVHTWKTKVFKQSYRPHFFVSFKALEYEELIFNFEWTICCSMKKKFRNFCSKKPLQEIFSFDFLSQNENVELFFSHLPRQSPSLKKNMFFLFLLLISKTKHKLVFKRFSLEKKN